MAPINVTTSKQQITASVSEDKVTATVSAGFGATGPQGPQGPPGTTSWNSLTDKPATFPPESHTHGFIDNAGEITGSAVSDLTVLAPAIVTSGGSLRRGAFGTTVGTVCRGNDSRLSDARTPLAHVHSAGAITSGTFSPSRLPIAAAGALGAVRIGSGISIDPTTGVISVSGASVAWNDISGKPTFATVATSGSYADLTNVPASFTPSAHAASHAVGGADQLTPADIGAAAASDFDQGLKTTDSPTFFGLVINDAYTLYSGGFLCYDQAGAYNILVDAWGDFPSSNGAQIAVSGSVGTLKINADGIRFANSSVQTTAYTGKIGTVAGLVLKTGTDGVIEALAMGTAGQVLKINSGATGVEWGSAAADVSIDTTAADILSASSGSITADDPGADRLVFWDDSAGKLTHLEVGTGLSISGTTITAAGAVTVTSPSQITANQNDYAGATADINRITSDAARDITGIAAGTDGQAILLVNVGSFTITLKHQSTSSTAANRIIVPWGNDYAIPADGSATLVYDNTTARWRVL